MERGGLTRRRGYMWLLAVLSVVLLIVLYITRRPAPPQPALPIESRPTASVPVQPTRRFGQHKSFRRLQSANENRTAGVATGNAQREWTRKPFTVSLNTADSLDLVQLYNIGPAFARRIVKYRALLGGFVAKEQLMEVYGMDSARYNDIAPYITIDASDITTLDVNTATLDELKRHPYLDYYQAKAIVRHREQAGAYHDINDLKEVALIDNETYNKLSPYLVCNLQPNK